jgi:hypothetical protein
VAQASEKLVQQRATRAMRVAGDRPTGFSGEQTIKRKR